MKVCLICNQIAAWSKIGGFGVNTRRLGCGLAAEGIDVHVVVPRRSGQARIESLDGITVHGQSLKEVFSDQKLYLEIGADIYHVMEPSICGYWAQKAMPDRVHLVTSMDPRDPRDWCIEFKNATWIRRLKYPIQWYFENGPLVRRSVKTAQAVYVEAEFLKGKTERLYKLHRPIKCLPKPLEIPDGPFLKSDRPLCVFLGRFDPRKRPEVFFRLARIMSDLDFVAVGKAHDRTYQRYLQSRFFDIPNLKVTGVIDQFRDDRLHHILSKAWILVHPSAREGLPTAFQEASAHEVAVLAHVDPGGYVSRFGRVVPREAGIKQWRHHLSQMIETGEWRERGKAGRTYNLEHHAIAVSVREHLREYHIQLQKRCRLSVGKSQ